MKGVILAGGKGSRLHPATLHIPKSLLPLANRITLDYAIEKLKEIGVREIGIVVGEEEALIKDAIGSGRRYGVDISFFRQTEPLGLAHAVSFAEDFVAGDSFALCLGDIMFSEGFVPFANRFTESGATVMCVVKQVEDPRRFGVANVEGERIIKLVEKPEFPESNLATTGLYFFGPQVWSVLHELKPSKRGEYEITDAIQILIQRGELCIAGEYTGEWFDTGTLESFLATSAFLVGGDRLVDMTASVEGHVRDRVVVGPGAQVRARSLRDCVILPGARVCVEGEIEHAVIGGVCVESDDVKNRIYYLDAVAHV